MSLNNKDCVFYAHSLQDRDRQHWQLLVDHLDAVAETSASRGAKFRASNAAALAGSLHDLGKYSLTFQRRLRGAADKVDHSTAGAQEAVRLAASTDADSQVIARTLAHAIAGHHAGLPDTFGGESSLDARLKKEIDPLESSWRREVSPVASDLMPIGFKWGDSKSVAYRLAFLGRMVFSCLVDADFRDTEAFYCAAEGQSVDREWPWLPKVVDELISDLAIRRLYV